MIDKSDLLKVFYAFTDDNAELVFNYEDKHGNETTDRRFKPFKIEYAGETDDDKTALEVDEVLLTGLSQEVDYKTGFRYETKKFYLYKMSCIRIYKQVRTKEMLELWR